MADMRGQDMRQQNQDLGGGAGGLLYGSIRDAGVAIARVKVGVGGRLPGHLVRYQGGEGVGEGMGVWRGYGRGSSMWE